MKSSKTKWIIFLLVVLGFGATFFYYSKIRKRKAEPQVSYDVVGLERVTIKTEITTTGSVEPQNRLAVKPPINGRLDQVLVEEGDLVKAGQIIAWISSSERAALIDAARSEGDAELKRWESVYKPAAVTAPIDGEVIVRDLEPGQTVDSGTAVVVLSDRLIIKARVDETDIGKVNLGQKARVKLDAYPDVISGGKVDHISYESELVNNVTLYEVEVLVEPIPEFYRSGMNAEVSIIYNERSNVLALPHAAVSRDAEGAFVMVAGDQPEGERRNIVAGMSDDKYVEVLDGLVTDDKVVITTQSFSLKGPSDLNNPFMPPSRRGGKKGKKGKTSRK